MSSPAKMVKMTGLRVSGSKSKLMSKLAKLASNNPSLKSTRNMQRKTFRTPTLCKKLKIS